MKSPLSALLVKIARKGQYGHSRTPRNFYMQGGYCEFYHSSVHPGEVTFEQWKAVAKLSARYQRFVQYVEETLPEWQTVNHTYWGDNSVDAHQVSKDGRTRTIQIDGPHGDVCF